jgi:hypothetical protein
MVGARLLTVSIGQIVIFRILTIKILLAGYKIVALKEIAIYS